MPRGEQETTYDKAFALLCGSMDLSHVNSSSFLWILAPHIDTCLRLGKDLDVSQVYTGDSYSKIGAIYHETNKPQKCKNYRERIRKMRRFVIGEEYE